MSQPQTPPIAEDGLWRWMEQEQREWLTHELLMWLRQEQETEARGSRDFGRGFAYCMALIAREGLGDDHAGSTGSVLPSAEQDQQP